MIKTSPNSPNFANLKTYFNTYKNIIRRSTVEANKLYYKNTFNKFSSDLRKTWNTIKETLNRNTNSKPPPDEFYLANDSIITENKIIANEFNKYFVSIGGSVENNQPNITFIDLYIRLLPFDTFKKSVKTHLYLKYFVN